MLLLIPVSFFADVTLTNVQISQLPVETFPELLQTLPGVVVFENEIHVNGYDTIDLLFLLDNSPISYSTAISLNLNMIYELEIFTSNVVMESTEMYPVVIKIHTFPNYKDFKLNVSTLFDQLSFDNSWNKNVMNLYINVPILYNFSISTFAAIDRNDTRFSEFYENDPVEDLKYLSDPVFSENDPYKNRGVLDERNYNNFNLFYKLNYEFNSKSNLTYSHFINNRKENPFDHDWKYAMEYFKEVEQKENIWNVSFNQEVNDKLKFNIGFDYHTNKYKEKPKEIDLDDYFEITNPPPIGPYGIPTLVVSSLVGDDGLYGDEAEIPWEIILSTGDFSSVEFVRPGTVYPVNIDNSFESQKFHLSTDYTLNENHALSTGLSYQYQVNKNYQVTSPWIIDGFRYNEYLDNNATQLDSIYNNQTQQWEPLYSLEDIYNATLSASGQTDGIRYKPSITSVNIQDEFGYGNFSGCVGVKGNYSDLGSNYTIYRDGGITTKEKFHSGDRISKIIFPQCKASYKIHPLIRFQINYNNDGYDFSRDKFGDIIEYFFEDIAKFENYSFDLTGKFEDLKISLEYSSSREEQIYIYNEFVWFEYYSGYMKSKSYRLAASYNINKDLNVTLNYSLLNTNLVESSVCIQNENTYIHTSKYNSNNFDFIINYRTYYDINFDALFSFESGKSYIPTTEGGALISSKTRYMDPTHFLNVKLSKEFRINRHQNINAYLLVKNLYDRKNELYVYPYTGSPYYDGADISEPNSNYTAQEVQYVHDLGTKNPANVSVGRTIVVGLEYRW